MAIFSVVLFIIAVIIPGVMLADFFILGRRDNFWLRLFLGYGLGCFLIVLDMFIWIFWLKLAFRPALFWSLWAIETVGLYFIITRIRRRRPADIFGFNITFRLKTVEWLLLFLIILQVVFSFGHAIARPAAAYDSIADWSYRAKVLYYDQEGIFDKNKPLVYLGGGSRNYPWLVPLLAYWLAAQGGGYNDTVANIIFVSYFVSLLGFFYFAGRQFALRPLALLMTLFLSSMPLIFYHSFNAYADLAFAYYIMIMFYWLYRSLPENNKKNLIFAGIILGIAAYVKNDFLLLYVLTFIFLFFAAISRPVKNSRLMSALKSEFVFSLPVIAVAFPWLFFNFVNRLGFRTTPFALGWHPEAMSSIVRTLFLNNNWNIWWYLVIAVSIVGWRKIIKDDRLRLMWIYLLAYLALLTGLYLFTEDYRYAVDYTAIGRTFLPLLPISAIVALLIINKINFFGESFRKKSVDYNL